MENLSTVLDKKTNNKIQYSTVNNINTKYSTVQYSNNKGLEIINNLPDLIPKDGYEPFYLNRLNKLGYKRFMELAQKARAGSETPQRLFAWFLKNNEIVN